MTDNKQIGPDFNDVFSNVSESSGHSNSVPKVSEKVEEPKVQEVPETCDEISSNVLETSEKKLFLNGSPFKIVSLAVVIGLVLAVGTNFLILPRVAGNREKNNLLSVEQSNGPVTAYNKDVATFKGQKIPHANVRQKGLAHGSRVTTPPAFIFTNGKDSSNRKILDVYADFSNQMSRDSLLMNRNSLMGMIENGTIELRVHFVPSGKTVGMYSSEALAEAFYTSPDKAWGFMFELLRMSATVDTDKAKDITKMIVDTAKESKVKGVDKESIENGTFASWLISVGDDEKLKSGFTYPLIFINGNHVDTESVNVNNAESFRRVVMNAQ